MNVPTILEHDARQAGLFQLTEPYRPDEEEMMNAVIADLLRGGIVCAIVYVADGATVWRSWQPGPTCHSSLVTRHIL